MSEERRDLGEWEGTVLGDLDWAFNNLPEKLRDIVTQGQFVGACLEIITLYINGTVHGMIDAPKIFRQSKEDAISLELMLEKIEVRTKFVYVILEKIKDSQNFFYKPGFYIAKNYRKVFPFPEWMSGTIFEEVWTIFGEFIIPNGIEEWSSKSLEDKNWNFYIEVVHYLRNAYIEEIERQKAAGGSSEYILEFRLSLIESLFECLVEEEKLENKYLEKKVEARS